MATKRTNTARWDERAKRWRIDVQKNNTRRSFYSSTAGKAGQREANAKADKWLEGQRVDPTAKVETCWNLFMEQMAGITGYGNYLSYKNNGKNHILPIIGKIRMDDLSQDDMERVIREAYKKGLAKSTLVCLSGHMTKFLRWARKAKYTDLRIDALEIPKNAKVGQKKILQPADLSVLFRIDTTLRYGKRTYEPLINAYRFQVSTGLRPGELIGLKWEDIADNTVHIRRSIDAFGRETPGKNRNANRYFALNPLTKAILDDQRKRSMSAFVFGLSNTDDDPEGSPENAITQMVYRRRWKNYCSSNGITVTTPYELRHTFVSIVQDLPLGQLKGVVGHSRSMDTLGTYAHEKKGDREKTAEGIMTIFANLIPLSIDRKVPEDE